MRRFVIAATIISLATPALAQDAGSSHGGRHRKTAQTTQAPAVKVDDKAYKSALDRVPTPTQKYDPWGGMRPADDKH